jgi:hypothetical protein
MKPTTVFTNMGRKRRVGGESRALAGFKVHEVVAGLAVGANPAAPELLASVVSLGQQGKIHAEAAIGSFGTGNGLKDQVDGRARPQRFHLRGDVGQHAALHGNLEAQAVDHAQQAAGDGYVVAGGVDPDDRVAGSEQQAVQNGRSHAGQIVGGVVGLEARTQPPGKTDGGAEAGNDTDLLRGGNQVLHPHELADGGDHLRGQAGSKRGDLLRRCFVG